MKHLVVRMQQAARDSGKVGLALLMWMLGVPGVLVLAYLVLG